MAKERTCNSSTKARQTIAPHGELFHVRYNRGMKRHPKTRWHPYLVISFGIIFLFVAGIGVFFSTFIVGPIKINHGDLGGNATAMSFCAGSLLTVIGIYALRHHKD